MKIVKELEYIPNLSLALGFFDGIHLGHVAVISNAVNQAKRKGVKSSILTFSQHPFCYFHGVDAPKYILSRADKYRYLEGLGLDYVIELDFEQVKDLSAEQYLENILFKYFRPVSITTGFSHHFGANKSGNVKVLAENQIKYGYEFFEIPQQKINEMPMSSTRIRHEISEGNIEIANLLLGRNFKISGTVVRGKELGRQIGFPTANIFYSKKLIEPPYGVYEVLVTREVDNSQYRGIANYGVCPTIDGQIQPVFETHILDFNENIYGEKISVELLRMIRHEIKFESVELLKLQIKKDLSEIV